MFFQVLRKQIDFKVGVLASQLKPWFLSTEEYIACVGELNYAIDMIN